MSGIIVKEDEIINELWNFDNINDGEVLTTQFLEHQYFGHKFNLYLDLDFIYIEELNLAREKVFELMQTRSLILIQIHTCFCDHLSYWHLKGICILCLPKLFTQCKKFRSKGFQIEIDFDKIESENEDGNCGE